MEWWAILLRDGLHPVSVAKEKQFLFMGGISLARVTSLRQTLSTLHLHESSEKKKISGKIVQGRDFFVLFVFKVGAGLFAGKFTGEIFRRVLIVQVRFCPP